MVPRALQKANQTWRISELSLRSDSNNADSYQEGETATGGSFQVTVGTIPKATSLRSRLNGLGSRK